MRLPQKRPPTPMATDSAGGSAVVPDGPTTGPSGLDIPFRAPPCDPGSGQYAYLQASISNDGWWDQDTYSSNGTFFGELISNSNPIDLAPLGISEVNFRCELVSQSNPSQETIAWTDPGFSIDVTGPFEPMTVDTLKAEPGQTLVTSAGAPNGPEPCPEVSPYKWSRFDLGADWPGDAGVVLGNLGSFNPYAPASEYSFTIPTDIPPGYYYLGAACYTFNSDGSFSAFNYRDAYLQVVTRTSCTGGSASGCKPPPEIPDHYVALGDSYAAGEGLGPFQAGTDVKKGAYRNQCHRSVHYAYADVYPARVLPSVKHRSFWACSGATVDDMEHVPPQTPQPSRARDQEQFDQPRQTAMVDRSTRWITVSVGGDDLSFGDIGRACGGVEVNHSTFQRLPGQPSCTSVINGEAKKMSEPNGKMSELQGSLETLYEALLTRAPSADLVVVGYPRIFPASYRGLPVYQKKPYCILDHYQVVVPNPTPIGPVAVPVVLDVGMPVSDAKAIDRFEAELNDTTKQAVRDVAAKSLYSKRIRFADTYDPATPRNCKGTTPNASVAGLELSPRFKGLGPWYKALISTATFHPTKAGQKMMAETVEGTFYSFQ